MTNPNRSKIIGTVSPHTVKKFELVEHYVKEWAHKLLQAGYCRDLVFIDCMCNSGIYTDRGGIPVEGTPLRVARILHDTALEYPRQNVRVFFNDNSQDKIAELRKRLPSNEPNFRIITSFQDGNDLLRELEPQLKYDHENNRVHYLLLYDPYDASIDWNALAPYFLQWGEIMINHMVSDPIRAISQVRDKAAKDKYSKTYLSEFEDLVPFGSQKEAYEARIREIIDSLAKRDRREYYVAAYPFVNTKNADVYSLYHCTSNRIGFQLYKKTAWKTFGGKSSTKHVGSNARQLTFDWEHAGAIAAATDESCFTVLDVAQYLQNEFAGRENVPVEEVFERLAMHPVFPYDGFRREIKSELKRSFGAAIGRGHDKRETISFIEEV